MKIFCIGTLDKFSRFYLDIERNIKALGISNAELKIYAIHISGFLYAFFRLKWSTLISLKAWFLAYRKRNYYTKIIAKNKSYKGLKYSDYISFHQKLNKNISKKALQLQALAYIDIFEKVYKKETPDYLITIGDSRLSIAIAIALAKQKNIKVYYIEQGPFNTTFFDDEGVNANLSIRNKPIQHPTSNILIPSKTKSVNYKRSPIYRGLDILLMSLFEKTNLYPPDLKFTDLNSYISKRTSSNNKLLYTSLEEQIILLILQVPLDVNMVNHSPIFNNQFEIIESVYNNLPSNTKLIIREHPLYINKYGKKVYNFIEKQHITIDNTSILSDALKNAKVVIVNNSTVGIEAIFKYKTVVVLGDAFYDNDKICLKLKNKKELKNVLGEALNNTPNKNEIDTFKNYLYDSVLIEGSITDKNLKSSKQIANHLIANY